MQDTMKFSLPKENDKTPNEVIMSVYKAMIEKGYDPINQLVGYLTSGDPTYVTSYNNARFLISRLERDVLLEEFIGYYLRSHDIEK